MSRHRLATAPPGALLLAAGAAKLIDAPSVNPVWPSTRRIPPDLLAGGVLALSAAEVLVGLLLLTMSSLCRRVIGVAGAMFASFAGYHLWALSNAEPPRCHCFGVLAATSAARDESVLLFVASVMCCTLLGAAFIRGGSQRKRIPASNGGFTLVETLLVIGMVATVAVLAAPWLSRVRAAGRGAATLADLRSHGAVFAAYTIDHKDLYPSFADPMATASFLWVNDRPLRFAYFESHALWPAALAPGYYENQFAHRSFGPSGWGPGPATCYWYSASFIARPEFWNRDTRIGPVQWGATGAGEVAFPSHKALLVSVYPWGWSLTAAEARPVVPLARADGSAADLARAAIAPGYPTAEGAWPGSFFQFPLPGMHTLDGVRGRDLGR